ncbi:hypothetical protein BKA83DRAFT_4119871 [Pisolithus microcarpus]|nr:hypothetical protein BKA83DRAFT_4119871 [Pisolithus microcarpus]
MRGCRHILNKEDANNLLIMIQPTFNVLPQPVLLDSVSIKPNIILLDMFFHILMFHRETFSQWRKVGCQDHGSYENFKELLEALVTDAQSKLNPSTTHMMTSIYGTAAGTVPGPSSSSLRLDFDSLNLANMIVVHICLRTTASLPLPSTTLMHSCGSGAHSLASVHSMPYAAVVPCSSRFDPVGPPATRLATKSACRKSHNEDFQYATSNSSTTDACCKSIHKQCIKSEQKHHDKLWVSYHRLKDALLVSNQRSSKVSLLDCTTTHVKYLEMTAQQLQVRLQQAENEVQRFAYSPPHIVHWNTLLEAGRIISQCVKSGPTPTISNAHRGRGMGRWRVTMAEGWPTVATEVQERVSGSARVLPPCMSPALGFHRQRRVNTRLTGLEGGWSKTTEWELS